MVLSLKGKSFVVMGLANKRSIAWGIARSVDRAGARLIFTYNQERMLKNVEELASQLENKDSLILQCDVESDEQIENCFAQIKEQVGTIHGVAHCIAFANREDLEGEYVETSRDGFLLAHNISSYSLTAVAREARPLMTEGGSIVTLTYLGGERVVTNYNIMGVAKASLDASVRYLANDLGKTEFVLTPFLRTHSYTFCKRIRDFNSVLNEIEERAPLRRTQHKKK